MKILLINQTFYPDPVSTGQHLTDLAKRLASNGHEVSVIAGAHGYDDPALKFSRFENYRGIKIFRIPYTSFGKSARWKRLADFMSFNLRLCLRLIAMPSQDVVVGLTSPPLVAVLGNWFCILKGGRFVYWVMDLNPDEALAAGWLKEHSLSVWFLKKASRWSFRRSSLVIALDRFMKKRIRDVYGIAEDKITVLPPWAHDEYIHPVPQGENAFRRKENLGDKFVVMYSGNHGPCHPLGTLLQTARYYKEDNHILFYFIGGGSRVGEVREYKEALGLKNIIQLDYQPLETLAHSLSAADLHVVTMGEAFVGIVHPCKLYGILSAGRPFVLIGPDKSAVGDVIRQTGLGTQVKPGDVKGLVQVVETARRRLLSEREEICRRSVLLKNERFSQAVLCGRLANLIEGFGRSSGWSEAHA